MPCCGNQRSRMAAPPVSRISSEAPRVSRPEHRFVAWFEYTGQTALTVTGPVTRKQYRFGESGARLAVDLRDRPSLLAVPKLREVLGP